jgi:hypothetical protein
MTPEPSSGTFRGFSDCPEGKKTTPVEPRLDVITLAVADLERALAFYRCLGLESKGVVGISKEFYERTELRQASSATAGVPVPKLTPSRTSASWTSSRAL